MTTDTNAAPPSTVDRIRAVFRQAGLYNHAADDLLCERLAEAVKPQAEPVAWQTRYKMRNGQWSDWQTRADRHDANSNLAFYSSRNTEAQVRGLYPIPGADND
jgi:hypothetical protein